MSGGSYNYAYRQIEELAGAVLGTTPLRRAFAAHLRLVAEAAQAIEWVDSCDYAEGDEDMPIRACLPADAEIVQAIADAKAAREALEAAINAASLY